MKTAAVLLLLLGLAFARGDTTPDKVNQLETKNVQQVVKAPALETASTRTRDVQIPNMQYQANRMDHQDLSFQQHLQQNQFYSHNQAPHSQDVSQQYDDHNQNLASFSSQGQSQLQKFHHQDQSLTTSPIHVGQEIPSLQHSSQRIIPSTIPSFQGQSNEPVHNDFSSQEHYSSDIHPQQEFHQYRGGMENVQDQLRERKFEDPVSHQISGLRGSEIRAGGFPQVYRQRSAFDNREQPIVLPGVSQTHSTSVIVSGGMKSLPVLPALVYSAGPVPATHAVAYSRPWFQGGAYVKQHWQTPYARYVYSHML